MRSPYIRSTHHPTKSPAPVKLPATYHPLLTALSRRLLLLGPLLLAALTVSHAQTTTPDTARFAAQLDSLRMHYHIPGLSYVVLREDSILLQGGLGFAELEALAPATPATNYRIASLTKPIAATILLQLQEAGQLDIHDPIKPLIPGYEDYYRQVKAYVLANEPQYARLVEHFDFERDDLTIWHHLTHTAEYVPGDTFSYNGFLYGGLARLMEVTLQQPFAEILQQRVLTPLAMRTSAPSQETASDSVLQLLAKPYVYGGAEADSFTLAAYPSPDVNAGAGIVSNVLDLANFDRAIRDHRLISAESQQAAWTNQLNNAGEPIPYGLGWFVQQDPSGREVVWHYGWQPGSFSGLYLKYPDEDLTFIVLANGENLAAPFEELGYKEDVFVSPFAGLLMEVFVGD